MTSDLRAAAERLYRVIHDIDPSLGRDTPCLALLVDADTATVHVDLRHTVTDLEEGNAVPTDVSIDELSSLKMCPACSSLTDVDQALSDLLIEPSLSEAVWAIRRFDALVGDDHATVECLRADQEALDHTEIITNHERFRSLVQDTFYDIDDTQLMYANHDAAINAAIERVTERLDALHRVVVNGPRSRELLTEAARHVAERERRPFDTTPCLVVLAPLSLVDYRRPVVEHDSDVGDDNDETMFCLSLRMSFTSRQSSEQTDLVTVPRWLVDHLLVNAPSAVLSSIYVDCSPELLETATGLWRPRTTEVYASFDACMAAAKALQSGT